MRRNVTWIGAASAALAVSALARAQGTAPTEQQRLAQVEAENSELRRRMDVLAGELEKLQLGDVLATEGASVSGLGTSGSKVFHARGGGVVIGGYGEALYKHFDEGSNDSIDALRTVLYFGYRFDERWLFDSEIEVEHASVGEDNDGEVSAEFAFLDGRMGEHWHLRTGLVLVPMGITNERHEPTAFLSANRPFVERYVLPTTWRELGVGAWGEAGDFDWRAYVINGFDARGFEDGGLRDGKQDGSEALAEDFAFVARGDWHASDALDLGASVYHGNSGQGQVGADVATTIFEAHGEFRAGGLALRALFAQAELDDVADLNAALGFVGADSVGETIRGGYLEVGYDLGALAMCETDESLTPFVRFETYDTQAEVPSGFSSDPENDVEVLTYGIAYKPNANIVFKLDFNDFDNDAGTAVDQFDVSLGFSF
jgi:hypothetical protein